MRFITLILLVAFSLPVQAWEMYASDDVIGTLTDKETGEVKTLTYGAYKAEIEEKDPNFHRYCTGKSVLAVGSLNDREDVKREKILEDVDAMAKKTGMPHHRKVDLHRIVNDVFRIQKNGEWRIAATDEKREWLYNKEYQNCIINGF